MIRLRALAIAMALLASVASIQPLLAQTSDTPSGMLKADIKLSALRRQQDNAVMLRGLTNLPDGTRLYVALIAPNGAMIESLSTVVAGGAFQSGPYTVRGQMLPAGAYSAAIDSAAPAQQPSNVQSALGRRGEKLTGPLVKAQREGRRVITTMPVSVP
ncbi:MAG: hypothetical protein U1F33_05995 [Alphaproteobacteria bacterium]